MSHLASAVPRRLLGNSVGTLAVQIVQMAANLGVFLMLARSLGKDRLGEFYTLFALVMALQLVLEAGVGTLLTRRIAQTPADWRRIAAEAGVLFLGIGLATLAVFIGLGLIWSSLRGRTLDPLPFVAAGIACAGLQFQRYADGVLQAFDNFRCGNFARSLQGGLFVVLVVGLIAAGQADVGTAMAAFSVSQLVAAFWLAVGLRCHGLSFHGRRPGIWNWLSESVPLGLGDMLRGPNLHLDMILLGIMQPAAVMGIYIVAHRPTAPLLCVPRGLLTAAFPTLSRMAVAAPKRLEQAFAAYLRWLWLACLPVIVAIAVCAEPIVLLLVGAEYLEAVLPMQILLGKTALSYLSIPQRYLFAAAGRQRVYARFLSLLLITETAMLLMLIPHWGYLGACVSCLAGEIILTAWGLYVGHRLRLFTPTWSASLVPVLAATTMAALATIASSAGWPTLLVALPLATVSYLAICFLFGGIQRHEMRHLLNFIPWRHAFRLVRQA